MRRNSKHKQTTHEMWSGSSVSEDDVRSSFASVNPIGSILFLQENQVHFRTPRSWVTSNFRCTARREAGKRESSDMQIVREKKNQKGAFRLRWRTSERTHYDGATHLFDGKPAEEELREGGRRLEREVQRL